MSDALRILKDVVDALAYAHAHGVVHRDIKPDNILISGHHAVVTDFGVAKAVSAASGGASSLTSLGVALGTPAYMAPEQAVADPHVDQRADIYSVGVLAYEMLCGRPPFTGMSPQQVLAAHVMQTPDPVTAHRSAVSPALNALVMRCLEKKPADRVQTADELLTQLDAMTTPSGGMAPSGAVSAVSSGTETALRRTRPVRVLALFTAASLVMLALVYLLMIKLGLPTWVFVAAVGLLVIGLPIIMLTGVKERERALAHATGTSLSPPRGMERLFTWRRALVGGGAAFAALTIVAIAYTAMRLLGIGPVGTLVASGVLKERQPIILADFENRAADSTLGVTLTEAFRVDLSQSPTVQLVTSQAIEDALRRMQHAAPAPLTSALARDVAQRDGVKAVVDGQIDPVGKSYLLSARIVSVADGTTLAAVRETAGNEAELIPALDRLSRALRERIGESLVTIRANDPLEKVTTGSLEALRQYTQAMRLADAGGFEAAEQLLKAATTTDTGFAMAWRKRAAVEHNMGANTSQIVASATHAFSNRSRLPELERNLTEAYYYVTVDFDPARAIAANRAALELDPGSDIALNNLSIIYQAQGQYAAADSLLTHAISLRQGGTVYMNLIDTRIYQGRIAAAESTMQQYEHVA
ncbi:MAG: protein kinase domain-containing protein, partial [Gemmatimonadaceae bacterium]